MRKKMKEVIRFTLGKNPTRIREPEWERYSLDDLERDLLQPEGDTQECIISLISSMAAPLFSRNAGKPLTSNFLKCEMDPEVLNPWYFCYEFNEGKTLKGQIAKYYQGTTFSVKKLNRKDIEEMEIPLPDMEQQKIIGEMYRYLMRREFLMKKQTENMKKVTLTVISKIEEDQ